MLRDARDTSSMSNIRLQARDSIERLVAGSKISVLGFVWSIDVAAVVTHPSTRNFSLFAFFDITLLFSPRLLPWSHLPSLPLPHAGVLFLPSLKLPEPPGSIGSIVEINFTNTRLDQAPDSPVEAR